MRVLCCSLLTEWRWLRWKMSPICHVTASRPVSEVGTQLDKPSCLSCFTLTPRTLIGARNKELNVTASRPRLWYSSTQKAPGLSCAAPAPHVKEADRDYTFSPSLACLILERFLGVTIQGLPWWSMTHQLKKLPFSFFRCATQDGASSHVFPVSLYADPYFCLSSPFRTPRP